LRGVVCSGSLFIFVASIIAASFAADDVDIMVSRSSTGAIDENDSAATSGVAGRCRPHFAHRDDIVHHAPHPKQKIAARKSFERAEIPDDKATASRSFRVVCAGTSNCAAHVADLEAQAATAYKLSIPNLHMLPHSRFARSATRAATARRRHSTPAGSGTPRYLQSLPSSRAVVRRSPGDGARLRVDGAGAGHLLGAAHARFSPACVPRGTQTSFADCDDLPAGLSQDQSIMNGVIQSCGA
jgi:hypothetical protein